MSNIVIKYLTFIGLKPPSFKIKKETYTPTEKLEIAKKHHEYLSNLHSWQNSRQEIIENKNSLLVGQSSIVISIVALFVPIFTSNFNDTNVFILITLLLNFLIIVTHYFFTVYHASKTLEIDKNKFMTGATSTVTKEDRKLTELSFINDENIDLVTIINHNNNVINNTGANLVYASRCFKVANWGFLFFCLMLILVSFITSNKPLEKSTHNLINIEYPTNENHSSDTSIINKKNNDSTHVLK